jgi:hypothetical protein
MEEESTQSGEEIKEVQELAPSIEDIAKSQGWNPEHEGPEKIDAAEFVRRKPLFDKIKAQSRELKQIKKSVDQMASTYQSMSEAQYNRGIKEAEKRIKTAEDNQDLDGYRQAVSDKESLESTKPSLPEVMPSEVQSFVERNPWFDKNKIMQADALDYKDKYLKRNPGAPLDEMLKYVETKIKKDYPEEFGEKKSSPRVAIVETGGSTESRVDPLAKLKSSMSPDEKRVMKMFTESGKMTEKEYLTSYAQVREI